MLTFALGTPRGPSRKPQTFYMNSSEGRYRKYIRKILPGRTSHWSFTCYHLNWFQLFCIWGETRKCPKAGAGQDTAFLSGSESGKAWNPWHGPCRLPLHVTITCQLENGTGARMPAQMFRAAVPWVDGDLSSFRKPWAQLRPPSLFRKDAEEPVFLKRYRAWALTRESW